MFYFLTKRPQTFPSLAYQNQNLVVCDKKYDQPIKTKFVVRKIAYFRMLRILKK